MFSALLLASYLAFAATPAAPEIVSAAKPAVAAKDALAELWLKPVDPSMPAANATVLLTIGAATPTLKEPLGIWDPDGVMNLTGKDATRPNVLAALAAMRGYGKVIVAIELPGANGDFGDAILVPFGANPDVAKQNIRPDEFLASLWGSQAWVAVISSSIHPGKTPGGLSNIGPDASAWAAAASPEMNAYFLTVSDTAHVPRAETCSTNWGNALAPGLAAEFDTGGDLSFFDLASIAAREAEANKAVCGTVPTAKYTGDLKPQAAMLVGSGLSKTVVDAALATQIAPAPILPPAPVKRNGGKRVRTGLTIGSAVVAVGCGVPAIIEGLAFKSGIDEATEYFGDENALRRDYPNEAAAQVGADARIEELNMQGTRALGLGICSGVGLAGAATLGVSVLLTGDSGGVMLSRHF